MKKLWWQVLCGVSVLLVWSAMQGRKLYSEYSVDQFYPKEHELLKDHDRIGKQFQLNTDSPFLFVMEATTEDYWLDPERIKVLNKLSDKLQLRDDLKQVVTLTSVEGASFAHDELVVGSVFDRELPGHWKKAIRSNPLLYPLLISHDFRSTLLALEPKLKSKIERERMRQELTKELQLAFPQVKVHSAGVPTMQMQLSDMIQRELGLFLALTAVTLCLVFYLLFTHWSAIASAMLILLGTNLFSLAMMSTLNIPMNAILVTLPVIVSVSVMSLLIHTFHLWTQRKPAQGDFNETCRAAFQTCREILLPNTLGIGTTALGFMALAPSPIPLIREYGLTVAMALTGVALLAQLMMFLALPLITPRMRSWLSHPAHWALISLKFSKKIVIGTALLTVGGILTVHQLNFSIRLFDDLPASDNVRTTTEWVDKSFGGILSYDITIQSKVDGFWKKPKSLQRLFRVSEEIRRHPNVGSAISVPDFFQGALPDDAGSIAETFFLFSMAEKNPLLNFISEDARTIRLAIRLSDLPGESLTITKHWIMRELRQEFPELTITQGGMAAYAHAINQEVAQSLIFDFWQPLVVIGLFLVFIFRSFKWAILACLPNLVPPTALILALVFTQAPVKPGVALIFSIALGFAFNNTLYLLSRMTLLLEQNRKDVVREALLMEGNPCLLESFIMLVGFSIFLISEFHMNQTFGGFMLISIVAGFVADLIFLPAFMRTFPAVYRRPVVVKNHRWRDVAAGIALLGFATHGWAQDATEILKKSQKQLDAKDDQAMVEMKIFEANGETKTRSITLQTMRQDGFSVLARILSPADIKDMAFLGHVDEAGQETQHIFLPSSGQVRRLVTGKTKAGLLGSEISPEDLNSEAVKDSHAKLIKTDDKYYWIEITPKKGTSDYTRVVSKIGKKDYLPHVTGYYIDKKVKKTVEFKDYKKIGPVWRAHLMTVKNHLNGRGTEVRLSEMKVNAGLSADHFTESNLKDN